MPITPLHLGLLAPLNHYFPSKVSNLAFVLITVLIDSNSILFYGFGLNFGELHPWQTHSFVGVLILATLMGLYWPLQMPWIVGCYLGGISHILLDMLVHAEMQPFYPFQVNPFYGDFHSELSLLLVPLLIWFISQSVSAGVRRARTFRAVLQPEKLWPFEPKR